MDETRPARETPYALLGGDRAVRALVDVAAPDPLRDALLQAFAGTADWMRNREG